MKSVIRISDPLKDEKNYHKKRTYVGFHMEKSILKIGKVTVSRLIRSSISWEHIQTAIMYQDWQSFIRRFTAIFIKAAGKFARFAKEVWGISGEQER